MEKLTPMYSIGDMVVHLNYGVGQIDGIEHRTVNEDKVECFKVKTTNGTYWFPTDSLDNPRIHPLASLELVKKAIEILQSAPGDLENDPIEWEERIDDVLNDGGLLAISSLVRDLSALKAQKKINRMHDQTLSNLTDRLLIEWAASLKVSTKSIIPRLRAYLKKSKSYLHSAA